ncbi:hypothetical protein D7V86_14040 [bacterium D16-51]|nr:hypothetical protein D7V96_11085 [bacterium D16-59]RKI59125.1 hypothetical protein D7V86_14040 [bacterium D16-51]
MDIFACSFMEKQRPFCGSLSAFYGILYVVSAPLGIKYPLIQFGFTTHIWTCVFSLKPEPGYTSFPSINSPLTESYGSSPYLGLFVMECIFSITAQSSGLSRRPVLMPTFLFSGIWVFVFL